MIICSCSVRYHAEGQNTSKNAAYKPKKEADAAQLEATKEAARQKHREQREADAAQLKAAKHAHFVEDLRNAGAAMANCAHKRRLALQSEWARATRARQD